MTNTKFRKRALLSSVAMLLVALVALGSATFAWFSTTNTAHADGLSAGTVTASNLLVKEDWGDDFAQNFTFKSTSTENGTRYNAQTSVNPVTTNDLTNWYTGTADSYNAGVDSHFSTTNVATVPGANVASATIYLTSVAATKDIYFYLEGITGSVSETALSYIRVAIQPVQDSTNNLTATLGTNHIFANVADDFANDPATYTNKAATTFDSPAELFSTVNGGNNKIKLGTATADAVYKFNVYVYYEGTDVNCLDSTSGASLNGINFQFVAEDPAP